MIHERTIKWHDLIEDPTDVPEDDRVIMLSITHDDQAFYTEYGKYDHEYNEFLAYTDESELASPLYPTERVLAWAEQLTPYIPKGVMIQ